VLKTLLHWAVFLAVIFNLLALVFFGQLYLPENF
jgi:cytochrome b561